MNLKKKMTSHYLFSGTLVCLGAFLLGLSAANAQADRNGEALVQQNRCYGCHDLTENLIGPPYQAIAARHAQRKAIMEETLAQKIIHGGGGNWGVVPMVPNEHVNEEDARIMAQWILSLQNSTP